MAEPRGLRYGVTPYDAWPPAASVEVERLQAEVERLRGLVQALEEQNAVLIDAGNDLAVLVAEENGYEDDPMTRWYALSAPNPPPDLVEGDSGDEMAPCGACGGELAPAARCTACGTVHGARPWPKTDQEVPMTRQADQWR